MLNSSSLITSEPQVCLYYKLNMLVEISIGNEKQEDIVYQHQWGKKDLLCIPT